MSADFYNAMADVMESMLNDFGTDMILVRETASPNRQRFSDDSAPTETSTNVTVRGLVKPYPTRMIDGTRIEKSDLMLIVDNQAAPDEEDRLTYDGKSWKVMNITTIKPTTVTIGYIAQLRV